ncbi:MAG: L-threonylcarbamoyladenylate synthase [Desulfobacterales bacterium]|nr:L-threonylcarbamoyladenylate synthase [Desulfobacterales bacterium]
MLFNKVRQVNPRDPESVFINEAGQVIASGGIVAFPTRNLYGLGADAFDCEAVEKIFTIKQRPSQMPLLILIKDRNELHRVVRKVPSVAEYLMDCFWPGGLTIIFESKAELPLNLTANSGKIGVRQPAHPVAAALVNAVVNPITGTSANISGDAGCSSVSELATAIRDSADIILDAGPLPPGIGSSIVDVTVEPFRILREGSISAQHLYETLNDR